MMTADNCIGEIFSNENSSGKRHSDRSDRKEACPDVNGLRGKDSSDVYTMEERKRISGRYNFMVNGQECSCNENMRLLDYLRDILRLTSVKEGCSVGACGTCTVLVDGKKAKACVFSLEKLQGKHITTAEGIPEAEMKVYTYCFGEAGAVQCGFCIPGMVIAAKSLLDVNQDPTREQVKQALIGNICRCTGYVRIENAILMAAEYFREKKQIPTEIQKAKITREFRRVDVEEKVRGTGIYADDILLPGMVYAKALRAPSPRAYIEKIHMEKARAHPNCLAVYTAADVPVNYCGHIIPDWDVMIPEGHETRYIGDAIALAVSDKKEKLDEILNLIKVEYEERKPICSPQEGLAEDAPKLHKNGNLLTHQKLYRGNADEAIASSKYVVTRHYSVPFTDHAFMEPECAVAVPTEDGGLKLYTGSQSIYDEQHEISRMLNLPAEKVHVESCLVGGGFGGKEDMSVQHHAALCAWLLKKPVKVRFSREESIKYHVKRHAMEMDFTTACDENGILTGMKAVLYSDTGAYASLGGPVLQRACTHAAGPYKYQNVAIDGYAVYTNNIPAGAYRGFGVTQSCFPTEFNIDLLAEMVGISPWEIRYKNAVEPGDVLPNGQIVTCDCALKQTLEAVKDIYESEPYAGIACAMKNSGVGVGLPDTGRCNMYIKDGRLYIRTSAACIGQGMATVCVQVTGEVTGIPADCIIHDRPNTDTTPDSGTTTASRQTLFTGEATRRCAIQVKADLDKGLTLEELDGKLYKAEYLGVTDPMGSDKPNPVSHIAYGYATQAAILDKKGQVKKIVAAHDVGTVINVQSAKGQIEGGVIMGMGYALTEDFPMVNARPTLDYAHLGLIRAPKAPEVEAKLITSPEVPEEGFGAKGVGEISSVPTAPAIAHAYYRLDGKERTKLPLDGTYYRP